MEKKNLILGGVLAALVALAYAYQGPLKEWQSSMGVGSDPIARLDTAKIDKLEKIQAGQTVGFEKKDGRWIVSGTKDFPAREEMITGFLDELNKAKAEEVALVSANKEKKSEFETDDAGTVFRFYSEGIKMSDMVVGKNSADFASTYISREEGGSTYLIKGNLRKFVQADWRDGTIFYSDKDKINKLRFQYPNSTFTIEKINGRWVGVLPFRFSVSGEKADGIAGIMSQMDADAIPAQTFEGTGLEKHRIIVQATGDGIDNTIMIGEDNSDDLYYAKRGDSDNIYLVSKDIREALEKTFSQLR